MADYKAQLSEAMLKVEEHLNSTFSNHELETRVNAFCQHVISAGGKRMRPQLVLLSAFALPTYNPQADFDNVTYMAAAVELLHTATLVHDDVIDHAPLRRGVATLNVTEGNHVAVLAGDYLFTRCFAMLQRPQNFAVIERMNDTLSQLVVGELYQLDHEDNLMISMEDYHKTIYAKTGVLFELATGSPAVLLKEDSRRFDNALKSFGRNLGIAFQIKDDMLDYTATKEELGKEADADLIDHRTTMPLIIAMRDSNKKEQAKLLNAIDERDLDAVKAAIVRTDALAKCEAEAMKACEQAIADIAILPDSPFKDEMIQLCRKAVDRRA